MNDLMRRLPKIDALLGEEAVRGVMADVPYHFVLDALRETVEGARQRIKDGEPIDIDAGLLAAAAAALARKKLRLMRPVINATGVVLHTNLGRAALCERAVTAVTEAAGGYVNLEYDVSDGRRGRRGEGASSLLCRLTGAEDCLVVNNNAAAVLLALSALAAGGDVVVSRGQLVEIGGSFRLPDVITQSGARLREVGTTNKTRLTDYERALDENAAVLLHVHTSNYKVTGFTEAVGVRELTELGRKRGVPVVSDLGSGVFMDDTVFSAAGEFAVGRTLEDGADVVTVSGDKLLGGPQAGIILGKKQYVELMRKHPLHRAVRIDKLCLAALEATVLEYFEPPERTRENIPTLAMLLADIDDLRDRAEELMNEIAAAAPDGSFDLKVIPEAGEAGGGSLPGVRLDSFVVAVVHTRLSPDDLARGLLNAPTPIAARVSRNRVLLDPRTLFHRDFNKIATAFAEIAKGAST